VAAELFAHDLSNHRRRTLSHGASAGGDDDLARATDTHGRDLVRPAPGALDIIDEAEADSATILPRHLASCWKTRPVGQYHGTLLRRRVIAAVKDDVGAAAKLKGLLAGHLVSADKIAESDFIASKPSRRRRTVQQALHDKSCLRLSGAADRCNRNFV